MPSDRTFPKADARPSTGLQGVWSLIRRYQADWTVADVAKGRHVSRRTATSYVLNLQAAGIVEEDGQRRDDDGFTRTTWRLVLDRGPDAPRVTRDGVEIVDPREALWRTLRRLKQPVTAAEIAELASTEAAEIGWWTARTYAEALAKAGYLRAEGRGRRRLYAFVPARDTGPKPPVPRTRTELWDPNLGRVVWP